MSELQPKNPSNQLDRVSAEIARVSLNILVSSGMSPERAETTAMSIATAIDLRLINQSAVVEGVQASRATVYRRRELLEKIFGIEVESGEGENNQVVYLAADLPQIRVAIDELPALSVGQVELLTTLLQNRGE